MTKDALGPAELTKLVTTLRGMRGTASYPPTASELLRAAEIEADPAAISKRGAKKHWVTSAVEPARSRPKASDYYPGALVFLLEHLDEDIACDAMVVLTLRLARRDDAQIHDVASLKDALPAAKVHGRTLQAIFAGALAKRLDAAVRPLPPEVGTLPAKGRPLMFLVADVLPAAERLRDKLAPSAPALRTNAPFDVEFRQAFDEIDQATGRRNYVLLHDLRQRLAMIPRPDFDAGLNELRRSQKYSLDSADGRHGRLTPEQVDAGIREAGSVLVYVARR
jgi:hypothetical protein